MTQSQNKGKIDDGQQIKRQHRLNEHEDGINCFEAVPDKHRLFAGSGDGQLSVWDLRKSSDLNAIRAEIQRKKAKQKLRDKRNRNKNKNELWNVFGAESDEEEVKPKTLKSISDSMGDEILSLCLMKYGKKLCLGMTSGFINIFNWGEWNWFSDRLKGHDQYLNCMIKYDDDCCITGCQDGLVRLISIYPHRSLHNIGSHDLNPIDHVALSFDKSFVVSFANGNKRHIYNRTNRPSLKGENVYNSQKKDVIKVWDMSWTPKIFGKQRKRTQNEKVHKREIWNLRKLPRGIKEFLELDDEDFKMKKFEYNDPLPSLVSKEEKSKKNEFMQRRQIDNYEFSDDDSLEDEDFDFDDDDNPNIDFDEDDILGFNDNDDFDDMNRRVKYRTYKNRESWIKHISKRPKIRKFTKHNIEQHERRKFFSDLC